MADVKERRFKEIMEVLLSMSERLRRIEETLQSDWLQMVNGQDYEDWLLGEGDDCQEQKKE